MRGASVNEERANDRQNESNSYIQIYSIQLAIDSDGSRIVVVVVV